MDATVSEYTLTEAQKELISEFRKLAQDISYDDDEDEHITQFLDESCLSRYLRARSWDLSKSFKMLEKTVEWRCSYKPHKLSKEELKPVLELGSIYRNGTDKYGRPILYIKPGKFNPNPWDERIKGLVYVLEQAINSMDSGVEKMVWIADFSAYGERARSPDGMKVAQTSLDILQNHFPERLGMAVVVNPPWWMNMLWMMIVPFMAQETKAKIKWVSGDGVYQLLSEHIEDENLEKDFGGTREVGAGVHEEIEKKSTPVKKEKRKKRIKDFSLL